MMIKFDNFEKRVNGVKPYSFIYEIYRLSLISKQGTKPIREENSNDSRIINKHLMGMRVRRRAMTQLSSFCCHERL